MSHEANPKASIIIPCRNEAAFIDACIASVQSFDPVPGGYEVIAVDGMSDDGTRQLLEGWALRYDRLRVLDNPARIVPTAMNLGIEAATGAWIVRLDAHARYPGDYLALCIATAERTGADNVGGIVVTVPRSSSRQARVVQAVTTHRFGVGAAEFRLMPPEGPADTVPFGCYRRSVFERIGLYDERLVRNQDYELNRRLAHAGGSIWLNPAIQATYFNTDSVRGLLKQAFGTGMWNAWMWHGARYSFALRHAVPGLFALAVLALLVASPFSSVFLALLLGVVVLHLLVGSIASAQQSRRLGWWLFPLLPPLFLGYHLTYGLGTLWGGLSIALRTAPVCRPAAVASRGQEG
jgi:glycosyltransferase involved in cell wall biosynthesis